MEHALKGMTSAYLILLVEESRRDLPGSLARGDVPLLVETVAITTTFEAKPGDTSKPAEARRLRRSPVCKRPAREGRLDQERGGESARAGPACFTRPRANYSGVSTRHFTGAQDRGITSISALVDLCAVAVRSFNHAKQKCNCLLTGEAASLMSIRAHPAAARRPSPRSGVRASHPARSRASRDSHPAPDHGRRVQ